MATKRDVSSSRKKVIELQRALEEASREFGLLADELESVHRQLKGRTKNAGQIEKLQEAQIDAVYLAGRFYALSGDGLDPEASGDLGRWGSRVGKGAAALLIALGPAADASQVLGADLSTVMKQSESAATAADKVTTCSLNVYLPGTEKESEPNPPPDAESDKTPASASNEPAPHDQTPEPDPEHLSLLQNNVEEFNQWRSTIPDQRPDLSGANLVGANLPWANLFRASLSGADLVGVNLSEANLTKASLSGANLSKASLSGADLSKASLSRANLYRANLPGATLTGAKLTRANLTGTKLTNADLTAVDLRDANLTNADLTGAKLTNADLTGAKLTNADLTGVKWGAEHPPDVARLC